MDLSPYLEKLKRMRLVRIVRSMDAAAKERGRHYFIADPLIAFWHRFVRPSLSSVAGIRSGCAAPAQEIGRIWHSDLDIDVAGKLLDGSMIYGDCKWWTDTRLKVCCEEPTGEP